MPSGAFQPICKYCGAKKTWGDNHEDTFHSYPQHVTPKLSELDEKDIAILVGVAEYKSYREIASELGISFQRVGQRAKRLGISLPKIPKKTLKARSEKNGL